uniref:Uncharacterized protein n=1 Tax=Arundo donax TaxID=35708 RepID=A0A0A9BCT3_ARUDO
MLGCRPAPSTTVAHSPRWDLPEHPGWSNYQNACTR